MKKTYSELIEYYENVSPREIIADMYFDYKEEIDNLNNLGKQLVEENEELKSQLQQKENIIKEVREYIKFLKEHYEELRTSPVEDSYFINDMLRQMFIQSIENYLVGIEDILDKENK